MPDKTVTALALGLELLFCATFALSADEFPRAYKASPDLYKVTSDPRFSALTNTSRRRRIWSPIVWGSKSDCFGFSALRVMGTFGKRATPPCGFRFGMAAVPAPFAEAPWHEFTGDTTIGASESLWKQARSNSKAATWNSGIHVGE